MRPDPKRPPPVAQSAPDADAMTPYDNEHVITYLRLLDAAEAQADWQEVSRLVLQRDPEADSDAAERCYRSHLARARWMMERGYRHLLDQACDDSRRAN